MKVTDQLEAIRKAPNIIVARNLAEDALAALEVAEPDEYEGQCTHVGYGGVCGITLEDDGTCPITSHNEVAEQEGGQPTVGNDERENGERCSSRSTGDTTLSIGTSSTPSMRPSGSLPSEMRTENLPQAASKATVGLSTGSQDSCNSSTKRKNASTFNEAALSAADALEILADPENWAGDPLKHATALYGHDTPYELARRALSLPERSEGSPVPPAVPEKGEGGRSGNDEQMCPICKGSGVVVPIEEPEWPLGGGPFDV